jgi:glycosyltransferase involved in cell wall biosynthesis
MRIPGWRGRFGDCIHGSLLQLCKIFQSALDDARPEAIAVLRIVHIDMGREMRGGQHQVLLLLQGLRDEGHTSELLARPGGPLWNAAELAGFSVKPSNMRTIFEVSARADLVHAHDARAHSYAALASRSRFVVSRRVAFPVQSGVASRWKYGRAERFLAVSRFVAGELKRSGIPAAKIDIVYDGVQIASISLPEFKSDFLVVALASNDSAKGRELVSEACTLAKVPVLFSDDLLLDLRRASLFVYISRSEGLGSAALLAMNLGVPVIASRVGGLPEIVTHMESGLLVENDPQEVARAITSLKQNADLASKLGQNGRIRIEREFSAKQMVDRTLRSYTQALAN